MMDRFIKIWRKNENEKCLLLTTPGQAADTGRENTSENTASAVETNSASDIVNTPNLVAVVAQGGRKFQPQWKNKYPWIEISDEPNKTGYAVCTICTKAVKMKLVLPKGFRASHAKEAFVDNGFCAWNRALESFVRHENSEFHRQAAAGVANLNKASVLEYISVEKQKHMKDARIALEKIFHTINFIAQEGLPFRASNNDERSKFISILKMRATDVPELNTWMKRTDYKWLHHSNIEEILKLQADAVLNTIIIKIKAATYYGLMIDETSDISRLEQVSITLRIVQEDLQIREDFVGFYETKSTTSETLYKIVKDVLLRFGLDIKNLRGQCFDGAANVRGSLSGLQTRIREDEPRAIFVHCVAHRLNLVVQDALEEITFVRDFLGVVKELINFVRESPKRLAFFKELQEVNAPLLSKFCPTRWCVRIKSLKTILANYESLMHFLEETGKDKNINCSSTSTALGFLNKMECFTFYFTLNLLISVFDRVETLNCELQKKDLNVNESHVKVELMKINFKNLRQKGFDELWHRVETEARKLELTPQIPRLRKVPRRYDSNSSPHIFSSPCKYYEKLFYEVVDLTLTSLHNRFQSETIQFLNSVENFLIKKQASSVKDVVGFYNVNGDQEFDEIRLTLHRDMLVDMMLTKSDKAPTSLGDVIDFLKKNPEFSSLIPEIKKLIRILLTIPASTCTAERSFSALRRLKTYLRSSLIQERLNHIAVLHVHQDYTKSLDLKPLINEWISRAPVRVSTFAM